MTGNQKKNVQTVSHELQIPLEEHSPVFYILQQTWAEEDLSLKIDGHDQVVFKCV